MNHALTLRRSAVCLLILFLAGCASSRPTGESARHGASSPAAALVARSIAFHDPDGLWGGSETVAIQWSSSNPEGETRMTFDLTFGGRETTFTMSGERRGAALQLRVTGRGADETLTATVDGASELDDETRSQMVLDRDGGFFWRDYFGFLAGMPMNLDDRGVLVGPDVTETTFEGESVLSIRVTFDAEVGTDIWYAYFDPDTAQMTGCRFYKIDTETGAEQGGEYIVYVDLTENAALRLPRLRKWYMNDDDTFLGVDTLTLRP